MRLKELREDRDYKQTELANFLNVAKNTYSNYENEKRVIPYELMIKLSFFYNTSVDYLLGLTDIMKPYPRSFKHKSTKS